MPAQTNLREWTRAHDTFIMVAFFHQSVDWQNGEPCEQRFDDKNRPFWTPIQRYDRSLYDAIGIVETWCRMDIRRAFMFESPNRQCSAVEDWLYVCRLDHGNGTFTVGRAGTLTAAIMWAMFYALGGTDL